jgi:hypothetical protein
MVAARPTIDVRFRGQRRRLGARLLPPLSRVDAPRARTAVVDEIPAVRVAVPTSLAVPAPDVVVPACAPIPFRIALHLPDGDEP